MVPHLDTKWRMKQNNEDVAKAYVENHQNDADNTVYWNKNEHDLLTGNILLFVVVNIIRSIFNFVYIQPCLYTRDVKTRRMWWNACKQTFNFIDGIFP